MSTSSIPILQLIQNQIVRYISLTLLITGTIGNILNCFIFSRHSLRHNSCSLYFFSTSIVNLIGLYFGCLTRLLSSYGVYSISTQSPLYCKIRTFFTYISLSASAWFIVAACADRFASSSPNARIRSFSQVKISRRIIVAILIILCFIWAQMLVCFDASVDGFNCFPATKFCTTWNNFNLLIFYSLLPSAFMLILGWMTIRHVRRRPIQRSSNSKDRQLTIMLTVQVFCVATLSLPISVQKIYAEFTTYQMKSLERIQIENFLANIVVLIALMNTSTSFYLFTLTSHIFRKELKPLLFFSNRRRTTIEPGMATVCK